MGSKEAVEILVFPIWQFSGLAPGGALLQSARPAMLPAAPVISGNRATRAADLLRGQLW
jgi:hypothetical protein